MNKILLWIFSVIFILLGLLSVPTSLVASILFLIAGSYLSPIIRTKYLANLESTPLLGKKVGFAIVATLVVFAIIKIGDAQNADSAERTLKIYQSNPAEFIEKVKKNSEDKKFYLALGDLDKIIPNNPNDQTLKNLRHEITIAEIKFNASEEKLYLFDEKNLAKYKEVMGASANEDEIQKIYSEAATAFIKKMLSKEETISAKVAKDNLIKIAPNSKAVEEMTEQIAIVEQKIKAKEEAIAKKKAEEQAAKMKAAEEEAAQRRDAMQKAAQSGSSVGGMSKVVSKVGSLIYLANGQTFAIERPTMLHIDGQIYPKGSGNPDYIQVGYRCRFTGEPFNVAEVFCDR